MRTIKNDINVSLSSRFVRHIFPFLGIVILGGFTKIFEYLSIYNFIFISFSYIVISIVIISYTNPRFIFRTNSVTVEYIGVFKWLRRTYRYSDISEAIFRHEPKVHEWFLKDFYRLPLQLLYQFSIGLFTPFEYKWVKISTKEKKTVIFCFGLEYDYYDNSDDFLFEDLKQEFSAKGIKTKWTENSDPYFSNSHK